MSRFGEVILVAVLLVVFVGGPLFFAATPAGRGLWNRWFYAVQKADDATNYETRKIVEDTCRMMAASYKADKLRYEQYYYSENMQHHEWGEQAKMRANQTAAQYNEYVLKNSYVFKGNMPPDLQMELDYIE